MKNAFETPSLFAEINKLKIKNPKLLDGRYILDDQFRKVITYATPFRSKSYWFIDTPSLPVSEPEKKRALNVSKDFLFKWSMVEHEENGNKAHKIESLLIEYDSPHANE